MNIKSTLNSLDSTTSKLALKTFGEQDGLSCFLFHAIKKTDEFCPFLYPQEDLSIRLLEEFIETLLELNYSFIGPQEIISGLLKPGKKYGLLTFDDGYFNNTWSLEVLRKYNIPAVFFVTTSLILDHEKQWSDVIFYERYKRGVTEKKIRNEIISLIPNKIRMIKDYITKEFGIKSFIPQGDFDRFMSEKELQEFSQNPMVFIGNHCHRHEALKYLTPEEIENEFRVSQNSLKQITGEEAQVIAYPYGLYGSHVIQKVSEFGFKLGFTTVYNKNKLPLSPNSHLILDRFNPVVKNRTFNMASLRSPFQLKTSLKGLLANPG